MSRVLLIGVFVAAASAAFGAAAPVRYHVTFPEPQHR